VGEAAHHGKRTWQSEIDHLMVGMHEKKGVQGSTISLKSTVALLLNYTQLLKKN
jgi:hypothetical protein